MKLELVSESDLEEGQIYLFAKGTIFAEEERHSELPFLLKKIVPSANTSYVFEGLAGQDGISVNSFGIRNGGFIIYREIPNSILFITED